MGSLPTIETYGQYSSGNYGAHTLLVTVGGLDVYFSYRTPVAFRARGRLVVSENRWGPTMGKHLNWIDGGNKTGRTPRADFERMLEREIQSRQPKRKAVA